MNQITFTLDKIADLARVSVEKLRLVAECPELAPIVGEKADGSWRLRFNANQTLALLIVSDLARAGVKIPLAAKWVCQIAETMLFNPDAAQVNFEFRAIGMGFFFAGNDAPEAASNAGDARFRLTFNVGAYRAVVDRAVAERAVEMGEREDA
jgi:hypothetical protein